MWYINVVGDDHPPVGHDKDGSCCDNYSAPTKEAAIAVAAEVLRQTPDHMLDFTHITIGCEGMN